MKEQEIIHYIFQDEMPDIEQVRENCINAVSATGSSTHSKRRFRTPLIAAIIAACVLFSGIAYAGVSMQWFQTERADSGGSWVMVPTNGDFYDNVDNDTLHIVYSSLNEEQPVFDADIAARLIELMAGKLYTQDGIPFDLLVRGVDGYTADDSGGEIFDAQGSRIDEIYYEAYDNGVLGINTISIRTIEEIKNDYSDSYDDAADFLGNDFRIPAVYTDGFDPPRFNIQDDTLYGRNRRAVYVDINGDPGMFYFVEQMRTPGDTAYDWAASDAEIYMSEIADTVVYKIIDEDSHRYTWNYNGLTYMFFNFIDEPNPFSDLQCEEIIRSMIE